MKTLDRAQQVETRATISSIRKLSALVRFLIEQLLPVPKGERNFKMTYLESYWELEGILPDLVFSAICHFFHQFLFQNFHSEKSYRRSK